MPADVMPATMQARAGDEGQAPQAQEGARRGDGKGEYRSGGGFGGERSAGRGRGRAPRGEGSFKA